MEDGTWSVLYVQARENDGHGATLLSRIVGEGISAQVTSEHRLTHREGVSSADIWSKSVPLEGTANAKALR